MHYDAPDDAKWHIPNNAMEEVLLQLIDQQYKANKLLENQVALMKVQCEKLNHIYGRLDAIFSQQELIVGVLQKELISLLDEPLLDKNMVMDKLNIKDSTYRRYVANGHLQPMRFEKVDWYFQRDILRALEESRRKGRI